MPRDSIAEIWGSIPDLKDEYSRILRERTSGAFSDGETSFEYRRERFTSLLEQACQGVEPALLEDLLTLYEDTLTESLRLKPGSLDLLTALKKLGKKIVVITEGPQDAQERTIQRLGIAGQIDFLATTNHFGVSKADGLFPKVLRHLGISPQEMVYIGDSEARDMAPAMAEGIFCIHFDEAADVSLGGCPLKINELRWLEAILTG